MWPNLIVADFDLVDIVCCVSEIDFLQVEKSVANIDMVEFVCGRYGLWPISYRSDNSIGYK